jgi:hypothetical protein
MMMKMKKQKQRLHERGSKVVVVSEKIERS